MHGQAYPDYRRVPKVTAPVTFGISSPKGPQPSGSSYFRAAKICHHKPILQLLYQD